MKKSIRFGVHSLPSMATYNPKKISALMYQVVYLSIISARNAIYMDRHYVQIPVSISKAGIKVGCSHVQCTMCCSVVSKR